LFVFLHDTMSSSSMSIRARASRGASRPLGHRPLGLGRPLRLAKSQRQARVLAVAAPPSTSTSTETRKIQPHPLNDGRVGFVADNTSNVHVGVAEPESDSNNNICTYLEPWDPASPYANKEWTVYRGVAYDLTPFRNAHPAGNVLLNLAVGRDATALFESYHLDPAVAVKRLQRLPVLEGFPVHLVPRAPYPNDSDLYNTIRERVKNELFPDGAARRGEHRTGSEWAGLTVLVTFVSTAALYVSTANVLAAAAFGLAGAWVGLTVQHCGNHGAMARDWRINLFWGAMDDLIGGSSLCWRYHHQVSHHVHCNDTDMDEDVYSAYPLLRFDARLPRKPWHKYQHIYMWLAFPFMQLAFQVGDLKAFFEKRTEGAVMHGAAAWERGSILVGKAAHYMLLFIVPCMLHGWVAACVGATIYMMIQGIALASVFAVSHNTFTNKDPNLLEVDDTRDDWGLQQLITSANWGGRVGCFFTGGLNLQIEHHLFPAISFMHYPAIAKIVEEEANKRGYPYVHHKTLPSILGEFIRFMKTAGEAPDSVQSSFPPAGGLGSAARQSA